MKKAAKAQEAKGVTMAGQVATYASTACGASYSDFLMSKASWKPILVRDEVLNMGYQAILD